MTKSARKFLGPDDALPKTSVAKGSPSEDEVLVSILKEYPTPRFVTEPTEQDLQRKNQVELTFLQGEIARKNDQIRRYREEIELQIKLMSGMLDGKKESIGYIRRIISKLKGCLEYPGRVG